MHRRKHAKKEQAVESTSTAAIRAGQQAADAVAADVMPAAGQPKHEHRAGRQPQRDQQQTRESGRPAPDAAVPSSADACVAAVALLLLPFCHQAAERLLAPQTGDWLAGSFCSLALFALAAVGAVVGSVTQDGAANLAAVRAGSGASSPAPAGMPGAGMLTLAWWAAAAAAMLLTAPAGGPPASWAGRIMLSPGLAEDGKLRISDAHITLRAMALAAALAGPLFVAVGCAAGAAGGCVLRFWTGPGARSHLALVALLAGAAAAALAGMLPPAVVPPYPASTLTPAIAAVAAAVAAALTPAAPASVGAAPARRSKQQAAHAGSSGSGAHLALNGRRALAALLAVAMAALAVHRAIALPQCGGPAQRHAVPLEGGRYAVVEQCEVAGGGRLGVIEGTYKEQYRYRLLRMDHSVLGGEYVAPADVAGQSIYTAFYLQQAAVLLNPNGTRSLHVGLGAGTAVKAMQRMGIAADTVELVPEVQAAAKRHFGLQPGLHGGRAHVGDALRLVPALAAGEGAGRYDYILHDIFSGGGAAAQLMDAPFFRQLSALLSPAGGVLAVNYYGGKGQGLKNTWCRLRLVFNSVRAFSDVEKARVRNHVLFASNANLRAANLTAAVLAAAARQAAAAAHGAPEVFDPLQLRLWRTLGRQEVKLTYDRHRCMDMLRRQGELGRRAERAQRDATLEDEWTARGLASASEAAAEAARRRQNEAGKERGALKQGKDTGQEQPPWIWRQLKALRERHALAVVHWTAMRTQFSDSLWLS